MDKISRQNAEHYNWGDGCDGWHLVKTDGLSVIYEQMPPKTQEERHVHEKARQFFFVLSGTLVMEMSGRRHDLFRGEGVEIPPGTPHQARNESDENVEFLVISQPNSRGDRIRV